MISPEAYARLVAWATIVSLATPAGALALPGQRQQIFTRHRSCWVPRT
jgi:hypothetical protein